MFISYDGYSHVTQVTRNHSSVGEYVNMITVHGEEFYISHVHDGRGVHSALLVVQHQRCFLDGCAVRCGTMVCDGDGARLLILLKWECVMLVAPCADTLYSLDVLNNK